jgi:precorrin isomerase
MLKVEESASVISAADESAVSRSCSIIVDVRVLRNAFRGSTVLEDSTVHCTVYSASDVPTPVIKMKYFGECG